MTTAAELIKYLETLPPETSIQVLKQNSIGYETWTTWVDLDFPQHAYFSELGGYLELGEQ